MEHPGALYPPDTPATVRMRLLLALALFASAAQAQVPDSVVTAAPMPSGQTGGRLAGGDRFLMVLLGASVSVLLASASDDAEWIALAIPPVAGLTVYGVGRALGHPGRLVPTLAGTAAGALPAIGLSLAAGSAGQNYWTFLIVGAATYVVLPSVGAAIGFGKSLELPQPVVLLGPGGERAAGLTLRASF